MQILPRAIAQTSAAQSGRSLKGAPSSTSVAGELSATYASSTQSSSFADFMNIYSSLPPRQDAQSGQALDQREAPETGAGRGEGGGHAEDDSASRQSRRMALSALPPRGGPEGGP